MNPGHRIPDWTIGSILKVRGIEPAPPRAPDRSSQYDADVAGSLDATLGPDAVQ
jgi:hypothetical protein